MTVEYELVVIKNSLNSANNVIIAKDKELSMIKIINISLKEEIQKIILNYTMQSRIMTETIQNLNTDNNQYCQEIERLEQRERDGNIS